MSTIAIFEDLQAIPRKTLQKISTPSFTVTLEAKIKYEQVDAKVDFQEIIKESHFDKDDVDESVEKAVEDPTPKLVHEISSHQHIHFIVADKFMEAISKREIFLPSENSFLQGFQALSYIQSPVRGSRILPYFKLEDEFFKGGENDVDEIELLITISVIMQR